MCGDSCSPAVACPTCRRLLEGCWFTLAAMGASPAEDVSQAEALLKRAGARVFDQRTSGLATAQGTPARLCVAQFLQAPHVVVAFRAQMLRAQSMHTALSWSASQWVRGHACAGFGVLQRAGRAADSVLEACRRALSGPAC